MQQRKLGQTDLNLTTIGLGTWAIGGGGWKFAWGPQDDKESIRAIHKALDLGINWIDTAPIYGFGHSEQVVRRALKGISHKPIIATKCERTWDDNRNIIPSLRSKSIRSEVEDSLRRLKVEVIDLYQIHWPDPEEEIEEGWDTIGDLIKDGKIRYAGVSNFNVEQMKRIQSIHPIASLQPPYSMLRRDVEEEILNFCKENQIGVVAYSPMQKGLLTGKITRERVAKFPMDDHRRKDPKFQDPELSHNLELVENLRHVAEKAGKTVAQLAIAWVLRRSELTAAIVGTRSASQIEETVLAGDWILSREIIDEIEGLLDD
jgi:aryl-alcohol dehydrogenase-like predicted oxidoreductase